MEVQQRKVGRPKSDRVHINLKALTNLTGKEIRVLVEDGKALFKELKRIALETRDPKVIEILKQNPRLREVLNKWEVDSE